MDDDRLEQLKKFDLFFSEYIKNKLEIEAEQCGSQIEVDYVGSEFKKDGEDNLCHVLNMLMGGDEGSFGSLDIYISLDFDKSDVPLVARWDDYDADSSCYIDQPGGYFEFIQPVISASRNMSSEELEQQ